MDDTQNGSQNSVGLDDVVDRFAKELVTERVDNEHIDLKTASFRPIEQLSHDIGRRGSSHSRRQSRRAQR